MVLPPFPVQHWRAVAAAAVLGAAVSDVAVSDTVDMVTAGAATDVAGAATAGPTMVVAVRMATAAIPTAIDMVGAVLAAIHMGLMATGNLLSKKMVGDTAFLFAKIEG